MAEKNSTRVVEIGDRIIVSPERHSLGWLDNLVPTDIGGSFESGEFTTEEDEIEQTFRALNGLGCSCSVLSRGRMPLGRSGETNSGIPKDNLHDLLAGL